jgi:hypothetical protein
VKHLASPNFWRCYEALPAEVKLLAKKNFELLKADPHHPSLRLKRIGAGWSARVGINFRAIGKSRTEGILWTWIGPHSEYDRMS